VRPRFSKHGILRALGAWAVVLVQVHLFFVSQLHNHLQVPTSLTSGSGSYWSSPAPTQEAPNPQCAACQIARHGIILAAVGGLTRAPLPALGKAFEPSTERPCLLSYLLPSGRDPPHC
jgi:hypothetical protein